MRISSYPKVHNLGHPNIRELLLDPVIVEEKVDGSQFSFGKINGELYCRSKGQQIVIDAPEGLFIKAVEAAQELLPLLREGWIYRGEYLAKPKHNCLTYNRIPAKHVIIFDVMTNIETYLSHPEKTEECARLGLECVPILANEQIDAADQLLSLLEKESVLGGPKIEGFVIKNYQRFGADKKILIGKHVCEAFKEVQQGDWKKANPGGKDILELIGAQYRTEARWEKAIQHLRDAGNLTNTVKDIGKLMKEVPEDIRSECEAEIKEQLFKWAWPKIRRRAIAGFPEFYKARLLESQFEE